LSNATTALPKSKFVLEQKLTTTAPAKTISQFGDFRAASAADVQNANVPAFPAVKPKAFRRLPALGLPDTRVARLPADSSVAKPSHSVQRFKTTPAEQPRPSVRSFPATPAPTNYLTKPKSGADWGQLAKASAPESRLSRRIVRAKEVASPVSIRPVAKKPQEVRRPQVMSQAPARIVRPSDLARPETKPRQAPARSSFRESVTKAWASRFRTSSPSSRVSKQSSRRETLVASAAPVRKPVKSAPMASQAKIAKKEVVFVSKMAPPAKGMSLGDSTMAANDVSVSTDTAPAVFGATMGGTLPGAREIDPASGLEIIAVGR
jgi:hypothetical protein